MRNFVSKAIVFSLASLTAVATLVSPSQAQSLVPLQQYWSAQRGDNFTTATSIGAQSAVEAGYTFARVEGYVLPASRCQ